MSNAISFSRWNTYKKCPACYEWQYVLGNRAEFVPGPAALRGTAVHNSIEDAYNQKDPSLLHVEIPPKMKTLLMQHLDKCEVFKPEMQFAVTKDWKLTGFEDDDAWIRGFMDNIFFYPDKLVIDEYKTGQEYDEHAHQKQLYGTVALALYQNYSSVTVNGVYIDKKKIVPTTYSRGHLQTMQFQWKREIDKMAIPMYPARPGIHCRYCPKSSKKGGSCNVG